MLKKTGIPFLLVLWAACSGAVAQELVLFSERGSDGKAREYRVSQLALESTPAWTPHEEDPPLSLRTAATIASENAKPNSPDDLEIIGFELSSFSTDRGPRWYYIVSLYDLEETSLEEPPHTIRVVLLMDGSLVEGMTVE